MHKPVRKLIRGTLLFILCIIFILVILNYGIDRRIRQARYYQISDTVNTLIFGNSHAAYAFNDSLIRKTKSFAQSGETYLYSFVKIRTLLRCNNEIRQIYLEVTNRNFEPGMTEWTFGHRFVKDQFPKYSQFMTAGEKWTLFKGNPFTYMEAQPVSTRKKLGSMNGHGKPVYSLLEWGGFEYHHENYVDSVLKIKKTQPPLPELDRSRYSSINTRYLDSIVLLCRNAGVKLSFVRSPMHPEYSCTISDSAFIQFIKEKYGMVPMLEFSQAPLADSDYWDLEHVNKNGSHIISYMMDSIIHAQQNSLTRLPKN